MSSSRLASEMPQCAVDGPFSPPLSTLCHLHGLKYILDIFIVSMYKRNGVQRRKIKRISSSKSKARIAASAAFFSLIFVYWRLISTIILENQVDSIEKRDPILLHHTYRRPKTNNTLEFVHITKTGETAIERAAARINIPWGVCHFVPKDHCLGVKNLILAFHMHFH